MKILVLLLSFLTAHPAFSCMTIYCEARCVSPETKVDKIVNGEADKVTEAFDKLKEKCKTGSLIYQTKTGQLTKDSVDSASPSEICKRIEPTANSTQSPVGAK
jgi:hypothetical protein